MKLRGTLAVVFALAVTGCAPEARRPVNRRRAPSSGPELVAGPAEATEAPEVAILPPGLEQGDLSQYPSLDFGGWDSSLLGAGGVGCIVTFDDDMELAHGYVLQFGYGVWFGGGARFMDFDYKDKGGERYEAKTILAYLGGGGGKIAGEDLGSYFGVGLGTVTLTDEVGDRHRDLAGGVVGGFCVYHDFQGHGGIGLAAELGAFFADPHDIDLGGVSLILGTYVYF